MPRIWVQTTMVMDGRLHRADLPPNMTYSLVEAPLPGDASQTVEADCLPVDAAQEAAITAIPGNRVLTRQQAEDAIAARIGRRIPIADLEAERPENAPARDLETARTRGDRQRRIREGV